MIFWQSTGANVEIFQNIGKLFKGNALLTAFVEGELSMIEKKDHSIRKGDLAQFTRESKIFNSGMYKNFIHVGQ